MNGSHYPARAGKAIMSNTADRILGLHGLIGHRSIHSKSSSAQPETRPNCSLYSGTSSPPREVAISALEALMARHRAALESPSPRNTKVLCNCECEPSQVHGGQVLPVPTAPLIPIRLHRLVLPRLGLPRRPHRPCAMTTRLGVSETCDSVQSTPTARSACPSRQTKWYGV